MATTAKRLIPRNVIGTAKKAFVRMNVKPIEALKEAVSNAMTWMHVATIPAEKRIIKITKNIGNSHDLHIEAIGTGISNYEEFVNIGHLPNTEEYRERLLDPEFLGQIGIGINSLLDLSEIGTVEFHNVSVDEKGRTKGFIAIMHDDPDMGPSFEDPPETPDSKYILDYVGLKVVVNNAKEYSTSAIVTFLSETFARKLVKSSNQDYKIHVKDAQRDLEYTTVHKPQGFCSNHEKMIGTVSKKIGGQLYKFPVYVDLHGVDQLDECKVNILIKKVEICPYDSEYMAKGYVWCDGLEFIPNRRGVMTDDPSYIEFRNIIEKYCAANPDEFVKKTKPDASKVKNEKKLMQRALHEILKWNKRHPDQILKLLGVKEKSELHGKEAVTKGWGKPKKPEQLKKQKVEEQGTKTLINSEKKSKHKKHKRKSQITDEDQESNPQLDVIYKKAGKHRSLIFLDLEESAIVINQSHEAAFDVPNYSDDKMVMLYKWAILEAVPEYRNISIAEFGSLMWGEFNCDVLEKI